jgi:nicotinate-nucleotide pyrophosphorylase (carboxylating)
MATTSQLASLVQRALIEDVGDGDWTTLWTVPADMRAQAVILAKAPGVIAGTELARAVFLQLDADLQFAVERADGQPVQPGDVVSRLDGSARAILTGERTALNFLQRLSGIATLTRRYVDEVAGTGTRILDTRKTTPGWRDLEKSAVRAGGGHNHRLGLHDMVLIKENHSALAGGLDVALERVRAANQRQLPVEVEVHSLAELEQALQAGVSRILLDNMDLDTLSAAVARARAHSRDTTAATIELEASGNMSLERVAAVARTGVDFISVGALTHSAPSLDLSLLVAWP